MNTENIQISRILMYAFLSVLLMSQMSACRFGEDARSLVVSGDFPLAYIKQPQQTQLNKVDVRAANYGSDLYMRDISSPEAVEINITEVLTNGKGAVASPGVSFDGTKIVFSLLCVEASSDFCNADTTWNIWTYDVETGDLNRIIPDYQIANLADDTDPAFLPDNRIVFSSTRQQAIREKYGYVFIDSVSREDVSVLHTMNFDGSKIEQISFNRSSDFNPSVLQNGKIMFSRRQREGDNAQMMIFTSNPDGSNMNVLYGAHSPGDAFVYPREMQNGRIISTVIPLEGTWGGGALLEIDSVNYSDASSPGPTAPNKANSGQQSATVQTIPLDKSISKLGRFTTPFPLFDGSNQVLVSFSFYQALEETDNALARINSIEEKEAPPKYGIYMLDMDDKSLKPIVLAEDDVALTDAIAVFPRDDVQRAPLRDADANVFSLAANTIDNQPQGIINVKSVYDTDQFGRMGRGVLTPLEISQTPLPLIEPDPSTFDFRDYVADIATIKNPFLTTANQRPARFIRITESIPVPLDLNQNVLGETNYGMQKLIGYAPIEPDGSIKIKVPADTPLTLSVLDKYGRTFEKHNTQIQVRPGEVLMCNGCHSPQRSIAINSTPIAGLHENTLLKYSNGQTANVLAFENETMAETRTRIDSAALELSKDIIYRDVWTDPSLTPVNQNINFQYAMLNTPAPNNGVINYPDHIQPIWERVRQGQSCVSCHNGASVINGEYNPLGLHLDGSPETGVRMLSYNNLLIGRLVVDENGLPMVEIGSNSTKFRRALPLVNPGFSRGSYLVEKLYGTELFAEKILPANGLDHSGFLSDSEKKLIVEWIDIGGQYFNTPFDNNNVLRELKSSLSYFDFANSIHQPLVTMCGPCHALTIANGLPNTAFKVSSFVLTGTVSEDFISATSMVNTISNPRNSYLLARPSDITDAAHSSLINGEAILKQSSNLYQQIEKWISGAL